MKHTPTEQTYIRPSECIEIATHPKFNIYYSNWKKEEKSFNIKSKSYFKVHNGFDFGWDVRQLFKKKTFFLKKKKKNRGRGAYGSFKNHIERKAYKNELKYE